MRGRAAVDITDPHTSLTNGSLALLGRRALRRAGLSVEDLSGVVYDPLRDRFRLSRDPAVNYMLFATRD